MKICFIGLKAYQLFNPKVRETFGGAEVQLYLLARELAKNRDLDIHFMVADYGQGNKEFHGNVKVWKSVNFKAGKLFQAAYFFGKMITINADVYIQRTLTVNSGLIALYCRLTGKQLIYMVSSDRETDGSHEIYNNAISRFLSGLVFLLAHKIVVQNQYQKKNLLRNRGRTAVVLKSVCPMKSSRGKKREYVLWVGRSEQIKRPELFLQLARLNPRERFVMVCPPSTRNPQLSHRIREEGMAMENMEFHSLVPFSRIDVFFQKAKVFVNTSTKEGFPNTFIQAAGYRTPILSLKIDPDRFIETHRCGFSCNNSFDRLNEKLNLLLEAKGLQRERGENAYRYARNNHDIEVNAKIMVGIII